MIVSLFIAAVLLSGLFSGMETGLYTTSRLRIRLDADAGIRAAVRARELLADMPTLLTVLLVSNNVANWTASLLAQVLLIQWGVSDPEAVGTFGVSVVLFLLAESLPKQAFRRGREHLLYPVLPMLSAAHAVLRVPTWPLTAFARWFSGVMGHRIGSGGAVRGKREALFHAGMQEGFLTQFQERVARGVLEMRSRTAEHEALSVESFPRTRLGVPGIEAPESCRDQRVLVLDHEGQNVVGWVPMGGLWAPEGGFRAARQGDTRPVLQVEGDMSLNRVYLRLDRLGTGLAVLRRADGSPGVLDAHRLRQRVMGADGGGAE
jgi:CBS domain containing-hemolysin-like protein